MHYQAVNACLMMVPQLDGCAVLTVEGLAGNDGALHPVQQALIDADATQCGFCTPGFAMAMFAFHHGGEAAEDTRIHEALAGNLCRCTGYRADRRRLPARGGGPADAFAGLAAATARAERLPAARTIGTARRLSSRRARSTNCSPRAPGIRTRSCSRGGTDLGLRVSKEREQFPVGDLDRARRRAAPDHGAAPTRSSSAAPSPIRTRCPHLDRHFPSFGALMRRIGSRQIRNLGTIAGNLATASPIGDTLPCLIALDADGDARVASGERTHAGRGLHHRLSQDRAGTRRGDRGDPHSVPAAGRQTFAAYKLSKRFDQDISTVIAAFRVDAAGGKVRELRAAYGGMAARAMRAVERRGRARPAGPGAGLARRRRRRCSRTTSRRSSDHRGGAAYRLRAAAGLLRRFQIETTSTAPVRVEAL